MFVILLSMLAIAAPVQEPPARSQRLRFAPGMSSQVIRGEVRGYDMVGYVVSARRGQTMTVRLRAQRTPVYFTVSAPGRSEAIFDSAMSASDVFSQPLRMGGDYLIRVYLYRNDARRGRPARYTLRTSIAS